LHRRSGLSRDQHAVLHGCVFTEACSECGMQYFRKTEVGGMSFQKTGRFCVQEKCCKNTVDCLDGSVMPPAPLHDTLLDWDDPLPEYDFARSENACCNADLVLALGTSLRIEPAAGLPLLGKQFAIVNLQETPHDSMASVVIRGKTDDVMDHLMIKLGYPANWNQTLVLPPVEQTWKP
jgi:NAD+-dependent protein deacetylase sirtuin 6